jgi:hypothetical protein
MSLFSSKAENKKPKQVLWGACSSGRGRIYEKAVGG